jgi:hypothetical protein
VRIDCTDAVGNKIAADVAKDGRASGAEWARLLEHARTLAGTKPSAKWVEQAADLVQAIDAKNFFACVSDWFNESGKAAAQKLVCYREVMDATLFNVCTVELLKGLVWIAVAGGRTELAPAIGNLAEASYKKVPNKLQRGQPIVWWVFHLAVRASFLDLFPFACPFLLIHVAMQLCIGGFRAAQAHPRRDVFDRQCGFPAQPGRNLELHGIILPPAG